jgi:hypothetical protein
VLAKEQQNVVVGDFFMLIAQKQIFFVQPYQGRGLQQIQCANSNCFNFFRSSNNHLISGGCFF